MNLPDFEKLVIQFMQITIRFMWATMKNAKEGTYSDALPIDALGLYEEIAKHKSDFI